MAVVNQYGTATLNATVSGPGMTPTVAVVSTLTHSTDYFDSVQVISGVRDIKGDVSLTVTRINATTLTVGASRQLPAGEEIVFKWFTTDGATS